MRTFVSILWRAAIGGYVTRGSRVRRGMTSKGGHINDVSFVNLCAAAADSCCCTGVGACVVDATTSCGLTVSRCRFRSSWAADGSAGRSSGWRCGCDSATVVAGAGGPEQVRFSTAAAAVASLLRLQLHHLA